MSSRRQDARRGRVPPRGRIRPDRGDIERAARLIAKARRPLLLTGGGIHLSEAWGALIRFAEAQSIPVAHTMSGKGGIACTNPLNVGLFGRYSRIANDLIAASDCLIVVGCKLGEIATKRFALPRPMLGREGSDFSFSGLKTAVRQIARKAALSDQDKADLAASFQSAVVDVLIDRVRAAMQQFRTSLGIINDRLNFVAAGGVAATGPIRQGLAALAAEEGFVLSLSPPALCTDNGAMVAWAGLERLALGASDALDAAPRARWPLESQDNRIRLARTGL